MRNLTMMTDLYQLTMMYGYYNTNTHLRQAVFDLYFRRPNVNSAYAIAAGLEQVMDYIENLHFSEEDLGYLKSLNLFSREFLDLLRELRFTGDIYAVPEGTVVFPNEPMVRVKAPLMEAQLIEDSFTEHDQSPNSHRHQSQQSCNRCTRQQCAGVWIKAGSRPRCRYIWGESCHYRWVFRNVKCLDWTVIWDPCKRHSQPQLGHELSR